MNKLERIVRTKKIIVKRWRLLMSWMIPRGSETKEEARSKQTLTPHHLHKYNLDCGCHFCRAAKKSSKYNRAKVKRQITREIAEQLNEPEFKEELKDNLRY